jgi:hypothetical protein
MRVSRQKSAESRDRLLDAAAKLFCELGTAPQHQPRADRDLFRAGDRKLVQRSQPVFALSAVHFGS